METNKEEILEGLNAAQSEAVKCTEGPSLIVAGAGSGKTKVLTCRIAYILSQEVKPWEVLALTFTKKAAGEMKERIAGLIGEDRARRLCMGTFHSVFIRFLREYAETLGYPKDFTIYDQTDSRSIIKQCIKELELDDKIYKPNVIQNRISLAKNNLRTPAGYRNDPQLMAEDRDSRKLRTIDIYDLYTAKCKTAGAMDFDDLLLKMNVLMKDETIAAEIASRFKYIMVDEYQDTNYSQYLILKKLAAPHHNLSVVGDDSQSIYSFRGARVENILRFQKDYPECRVFRLEQNYRSTQTIVNAANSLIARNEHRIKKECYSMAGQGEKIHLIKAFTEQEEAELTASSIIDRIYSDKAAYRDFAILYRTNAQSRTFEEKFRRKNLPYRIYGGHSFFERAEIKDMLAYFKLVVNPLDDESFRRTINLPARGLGDTSMEHLAQAARDNECTLLQAASLDPTRLAAVGLKEGAILKFKAFAEMIGSLSANVRTTDAFTIAAQIGDKSGMLLAMKNDTTPEGQGRFENVEELYNNIKQYTEEEAEYRREMGDDAPGEGMEVVTLGDFLENIALLSEVEKDDMQDPDADNDNKITLMTVHAAKGLEFPYVYVAGMEENLFPSDSMNCSLAEIEEERRLFYVALTRAQTAVSISFAKNRMRWGKSESNNPSRFVREIDPQYLDFPLAENVVEEPEAWGGFRGGFRGDFRGGFQRDRMPYRGQSGQSYRPQSTTRPQMPQPKPQPQPSVKPSFSQPVRVVPDLDFKPSPISELAEGQRVEHDRFGYGKIISFSDTGINRKAVVEFDKGGCKTLLLKFAKLRIL